MVLGRLNRYKMMNSILNNMELNKNHRYLFIRLRPVLEDMFANFDQAKNKRCQYYLTDTKDSMQNIKLMWKQDNLSSDQLNTQNILLVHQVPHQQGKHTMNHRYQKQMEVNKLNMYKQTYDKLNNVQQCMFHKHHQYLGLVLFNTGIVIQLNLRKMLAYLVSKQPILQADMGSNPVNI